MHRFRHARPALSLLLLLAACTPAERSRTEADAPDAVEEQTGATDDTRPVARFAGQTLTAGELRAAMSDLAGAARGRLADPQRRREFLDSVITNRLLYAEGVQLGYDDDPEIRRQVERFHRRLVVQRVMRERRTPPDISDEEARADYDANPTLYSTTRVKASHILLTDLESARAVRAELERAPARFAELARERSQDKASARRGGDLGFFAAGRMAPAFERAAFALEPGQLSEPIETRYGWHLITVTERDEGEPRPFESVQERIKVRLANERLRENVARHLEEMRMAADVFVDEAVLASIEAPPPLPARRGHGR